MGFAAVSERARVKRFEDMIRSPGGFARQICDEVGLVAADHADEPAAWAQRVQDTNSRHFVEAKTSRNYSRPDHERRVGRWRENLTDEDVARPMPMVRNAAQQFGYDFDG